MTTSAPLPSVGRTTPFLRVSLVAFVTMLALLLGTATHFPATQAQAPTADAPQPAPLALTADEVAVFDAWASGKHDAAYVQLLAMIETAAKPSGGEDGVHADRLSALCEMLWTVVEEEGWYARVSADVAKLPPVPEVVNLIGRSAMALSSTAGLDFAETVLGYIAGWMVCGPFDNERGAGFDTAWLGDREAGDEGAERTDGVDGSSEVSSLPEFDVEYEGKAGHPATWRAVSVAPRLGYVDLDALHRPNDHACAYAFTLVEAPEACVAELAIASDEGVRVWLNGRELIFARRTASGGLRQSYGSNVHRSHSFDQDLFAVPLARGINTLMLKVMEEEGAWGFSARIRAEANTSLKLMAPSELTTWEAKMPRTLTVTDGGAASSWAGKGQLESAREFLWAGASELFRGRTERKDRVAYHLLAKARSMLGADGNVREALHVAFLLSMAAASTAETMAGVDENERRDLLMWIAERDAGYVPALVELANHYTYRLAIPTRAADYARRALAVAPRHVSAAMLLARSHADRGLMEEYRRTSVELAASGSLNTSVHRYLGFMLERAGDHGGALKHFRRAMEIDARDSYSRGEVMKSLARSGDIEGYVRMSREAESLRPFDISVVKDRAVLIAGRGQEREALGLLENALLLAPHDDGLLEEAARMAVRVADTLTRRFAPGSGGTTVDGVEVSVLAERHRESALGWYKTAVERNPTRSDIQRYLEYLSSEAPVWEERLGEDITERIASSFEATYSDQAPGHWLWIDHVTQVAGDGTASRFVHMALKVTSAEGCELLRFFPVLSWGDIKVVLAQIHRADGETIPSRVSDRIVLNPTLEVGDVFEVRWRAFENERGFFGDYFGDIVTLEAPPLGRISNRFRALTGLAVDDVRITHVLPLSRTYHFHHLNGAPEPDEWEQDGHRVVRHSLSALARVEPEIAELPSRQLRPTVQVSTFKDWGAFGAWYWNLIERQVRSTPAIAEKVAELTAGLATEELKARAIYNFVVTAIRYNANWEFGVHGYKPYEAGAIFDRCIGDCKDKAILIVTMLRDAGITAWPVLIEAEEMRGRPDLTLAMPNHFNHAIAYIEFSDGSKRFVDGTATYVAWDEGVPSMDAGARVLVVRPGGGEMVDVPVSDPKQNRDLWDCVVKLRPDGHGDLVAANTPLGVAASRWRQMLEVEGQRIVMLSTALASVSPGAKVTGVEASEMTNLDMPVKFGFTGEMPQAARLSGDTLTTSTLPSLVMPVAWTQTGWGVRATRNTDMLLARGLGERLICTFVPPPGFVAGALPETAEVKDPHIEYRQSYEVIADGPNAGGIRVTREWGIIADVVEAKHYEAFRAALQKIDQANALRVSFERKGG